MAVAFRPRRARLGLLSATRWDAKSKSAVGYELRPKSAKDPVS